ncbi:MAG: hypothetical protein M1346_01270 [Gammaproteobacteria bacterium]|nr:hypothetical protein [Gammaproteobacteria bacterium]
MFMPKEKETKEAELVIVMFGGLIHKVCCANDAPVRVVLADYDVEGTNGIIVTDKDGNKVVLEVLEVEYDSLFAEQMIELI